jgi:hypothetical protein
MRHLGSMMNFPTMRDAVCIACIASNFCHEKQAWRVTREIWHLCPGMTLQHSNDTSFTPITYDRNATSRFIPLISWLLSNHLQQIFHSHGSLNGAEFSSNPGDQRRF